MPASGVPVAVHAGSGYCHVVNAISIYVVDARKSQSESRTDSVEFPLQEKAALPFEA